MLDLVLFDSQESRSFSSFSFSRSFDAALGELNCLLEVAIADDRIFMALWVYHGYVWEIFIVIFSIDLIPILMGDVCLIIGMGLLKWFVDLIDCKKRMMVVRTLSVEDLTIHG